MGRRSSIKGDFKLRGVLRRIGNEMESDLRPAMQESADLVLQTQRQLIPKDTGEAAAALQAFVSKSGLDAQIGIRGKRNNRHFFYLRILEYGSKGYNGAMYRKADGNAVGGAHTVNRDKSKIGGRRNALRRRATKNKSDGKTFFGLFPNIPARRAKPWLRPSIDVNRERIRGVISSAIASTLRKAAEGK